MYLTDEDWLLYFHGKKEILRQWFSANTDIERTFCHEI